MSNIGLPKSREAFIETCLQNLGKPVIEINVADIQVNNRVDQALDWWQHNHTDGSQLDYLAIRIKPTDIEKGYVTLPDDVIGISRVIPPASDFGIAGSSLVTFDYRMTLYEMLSSSGQQGSLTTYYLSKQYHQELQRIFNAWPRSEFTRYHNRLEILSGWGIKDGLQENDYLYVECYRKIDPDIYTEAWSDYALIELATALIKFQWGSNITKYSSVVLPSGITLNGDQIINDAKEDIERIKEDIDTRYSPPPRFFVG